jgi:uncharacterized cupredoxin-like copper-binding protein
MRSHRLWLALAIAISSVVLGLGVTAILGAAGMFTRHGPVAPYGPYPNPSGGWTSGMMAPGMMGPGMTGRYPAAPTSCPAPALPGTVVDVTLTDMGGMMGAGMMGPSGSGQNTYQWPHMGMMGTMGMQRIFVSPSTVPAGQVSFRAVNTGWLNHELVVLPLAQGQVPGQRAIGPDGTVDEAGSLGEASRTCGADKGDEQSTTPAIAPGTTGWTTTALLPGRYELICNIAGHYGAGMYTELDVVGNR